jgi:4-amino-4-deoxy-L-arabinose transferase-like glycosyltransferase
MRSSTGRGSDKKQRGASLAIWPWVGIAIVIIAAAYIRSGLLSLPLERDEGEYAYIAQQMLKGVPPYVSAYSMKLPGIYIVYAVILAVFGQTQTAIHLGLLVFNAATIFVIFLLARRFFGAVAGVTAGGVYALVSMTSQVLGLWANAEHFVILPALFGLWLIAGRENKIGKGRLLIAGLLLGLAFIIKQTGVFFALFTALYIIFEHFRNRPVRWLNLIVSEIILAVGVAVPFACTCLFYLINGTFGKFWFWTFTYASEYTAILSLSDAWKLLKTQGGLIAGETYPVWGLAILGLFAVIIVKRYRHWAVFAAGLLIFSFMAVCPGFYFREHYFILFLPAAAILCGAGLGAIDGIFAGKKWMVPRVIITGAIALVVAGYTLYNQRGMLFAGGFTEAIRFLKRLR